MGKKGATPNRGYTDEFKLEAVRLAESMGGDQAARRLGIPPSTMWNWILRDRKGELKPVESRPTPTKRSQSELEAENDRLRRELANAKADLEIVKKAAAYFAKESR